MSSPFLKSWTQRLLEFALAVAAVAFVLGWAWQRLQPMLPGLLVLGVLTTAMWLQRRRSREW